MFSNDPRLLCLLRWWQYRRLARLRERVEEVKAELLWLDRECGRVQRRAARAEALCPSASA